METQWRKETPGLSLMHYGNPNMTIVFLSDITLTNDFSQYSYLKIVMIQTFAS